MVSRLRNPGEPEHSSSVRKLKGLISRRLDASFCLNNHLHRNPPADQGVPLKKAFGLSSIKLG
jgi:hypothetical protein